MSTRKKNVAQEAAWLTVSNHDVVSGINKNRLAQGEGDVTRNDGRVDSGIELRKWRLGESSDEFLDISYALCGSSCTSRSLAIPERQICSEISHVVHETIS